MKLILHLEESLYNCALTVRDSRGVRGYELTVRYDPASDPTGGATLPACFLPRDPLLPGPAHVTYAGDTLAIEVTGESCELTLIPTCVPAFLQDIRDLKGRGFWEELICRALGKLAEVAYTALFARVGCTYRISLQDRIGRDTTDCAVFLRITPRLIRRGWALTEELLDAMPVYAFFYELGEGDRVYVPGEVLVANRSEVLRTARRVGAMTGMLNYPITVSRTKRLTHRRGLRRTLSRLYRLSPERRQARFSRDTQAGCEA